MVYEGKRLRPVHEYPPIRVRGGGAFYPAAEPAGGAAKAPSGGGGNNGGGGIPNGPPIAMSMSTSSLSSIRRQRSAGAADCKK